MPDDWIHSLFTDSAIGADCEFKHSYTWCSHTHNSAMKGLKQHFVEDLCKHLRETECECEAKYVALAAQHSTTRSVGRQIKRE